MISFTTNIKNELTTYNGNKNENITLLSAYIRYSGHYDLNIIEFITENSKVARKIFSLIKEIYNVNPIITNKNNSFNRNRLYVITINEKVKNILTDLSIINSNNEFINNPSDYIIDSEEEKRSYLKGLFMACGSVNDPKTSRYHLEFFVNDIFSANFISLLLNEFSFNSRIIQKDKKYMVYIKEAEKIGDFLRLINANEGVMYYEDIRIYRDHKNMTNRLNNMEQANIEKTINSCNEQLEYINELKKLYPADAIDDKTKELILYREKYPEASLSELSYIMSIETGKNITKSGLNHRFRKIKEMITKED